MRICPLHKTELVYEYNSKHRLVCLDKNCSHLEHTSATNPDKYQPTALPFWCSSK